jgi:hypothetical protein
MNKKFDTEHHIRGYLNTTSKEQEIKILKMFPADITSKKWLSIEKSSLYKDYTTDNWSHKLAILNCDNLEKLKSDCLLVQSDLEEQISTLNIILTNKQL